MQRRVTGIEVVPDLGQVVVRRRLTGRALPRPGARQRPRRGEQPRRGGRVVGNDRAHQRHQRGRRGQPWRGERNAAASPLHQIKHAGGTARRRRAAPFQGPTLGKLDANLRSAFVSDAPGLGGFPVEPEPHGRPAGGTVPVGVVAPPGRQRLDSKQPVPGFLESARLGRRRRRGGGGTVIQHGHACGRPPAPDDDLEFPVSSPVRVCRIALLASSDAHSRASSATGQPSRTRATKRRACATWSGRPGNTRRFGTWRPARRRSRRAEPANRPVRRAAGYTRPASAARKPPCPVPPGRQWVSCPA